MPFTNRLIDKLANFNPYHGQFIQARDLAQKIFRSDPPTSIQVISTEKSYFVDHGIEHVERIIGKLDLLDGFLQKQLDSMEIFILLVATYYHDMGMFIGKKSGENPDLSRSEHHVRSADVIQGLNDAHHLRIDQHELKIMKRVIKAHRKIPLTDLPENQRIEGFCIRTRLLGALLRMADSCDCDRSRAPKAIFDIYYDSIPESSREYWRMHFAVTDVSFDDRRASIIVSIDFSENLKERIENYRIGNLLKKKLEEELKSVKQVFQDHAVSLVRVEIRDFGSEDILDFRSPPPYGDFATVILRSNTEKTDDLITVVSQFVSKTQNAVPLVVEFRPYEGPLFVDSHVRIDIERLDEMNSQLQTRLDEDFRGLEKLVVQKKTIRRGPAA